MGVIQMKDYEYQRWALGNIIKDKAETNGDKAFLQFEEGKEVSYREADRISDAIANGLLKLGVKKGDKVAIFLPNCLEAVYTWFACSKLGVADVPINLANRGVFLSHVINDSEAKVIVIDQQLIDRLKFIENDLSKLEKVVIWSKSSAAEEIPKLRFDFINYQELRSNAPERPQTDVRPSDVQSIIYTSGTTGPSKGVIVSHAQVYLASKEYDEYVKVTSEDIFFTCLPVFHANARWLCILPAMLSDTKVVIHERLSASRLLDQIRKANATIFNSLGAMASFIYNQPRKADDGDNPARVCVASPMPPEIFKDFEKRFDIKVVEGYGLTEAGLITYNLAGRRKIGSCGKETKNFEVRILDEDDRPVSPGTLGEIVVRGKVPWATCSGYYNMPDKTVEAFRNFYFHTGDAGYLDEGGYLYFRDRVKDYIRRRGENISSFEVEGVINSHPKIAESAAVAIKSDVGEDEVKIAVVLKEGEKLAPEELLAFCEPRMPFFAVPRFVEFVGSLPKTPNEKVQKGKLRQAGITENTWDREKAGYKVKR